MADRPQAAALLRQHRALEQWLRTEWNRPVDGNQIIWSNDRPPENGDADHVPAPQYRLITIHVSERLSPVDQLVCLSFETCNTRGFPRFNALVKQATEGTITREDFVDALESMEYDAVLRLKECLPKLMPLSTNDAGVFYRRLLEIPVGFREYQAWSVRVHSKNYLRAHDLYSRRYDEIAERRELPAFERVK
jgi:hypothetical protein